MTLPPLIFLFFLSPSTLAGIYARPFIVTLPPRLTSFSLSAVVSRKACQRSILARHPSSQHSIRNGIDISTLLQSVITLTSAYRPRLTSPAQAINTGEPPPTPHRMDLLPLCSDIRCITVVPHVIGRYQIAASAAQAVPAVRGLGAGEAFARRAATYESPRLLGDLRRQASR